MNDAVHIHQRKKDRCIGCVVDAGEQLASLKRETSEQSVMLKDINTTVSAINRALVGDLEKQGLIGRVDAQIKEISKDVSDLKAWKKKSEDAMRALTWRLAGYGIAFIVLIVIAVEIYIKTHGGKI